MPGGFGLSLFKRTAGQRVIFQNRVKRFPCIDGDRIADLFVEGLQYFDLGDALVRGLRHSPFREIQLIDLPRRLKDVHAVLPRQGIKSTASLSRPYAGRAGNRLKILLSQTEHRDQPHIHEMLAVIVMIHRVMHVGRCHPEAGKKSDRQKTHHKQ